MTPFDIINDLSSGKKDLVRNSDNPEHTISKTYNSWLTNKNFSYFPDTIPFANEVNLRPDLTNIMQHDFYLNILRPKKRFAKWPKKTEQSDLDIICRYYNVNKKLAEEYLSMMNSEDIAYLKSKFETGGIKK